MEKYYHQYKCLLEYFVTHLEYVQTESKTIPGYKKYIEPILGDFITTGVGYKNQAMQTQISDWSEYGEHQVCINITCSFGSYMTNQCYLNWQGTWFNTRPEWDKSKNRIIRLYLSKQARAAAKSELSFSLSELGLFDNLSPNDNLKKFFDLFESLIINEEKHNAMLPYTNLLIDNKNLILTGAPGTGKTYLAKLIARELGATEGNQQCMMVQFHPSYDYTDFVEGLRPFQKDGETNIGFELKRGSFKDFCAQALENLIDSQKSTQDINKDAIFKSAYYDMIDKIRNEEIKEIPLKSESMSMEIVDVSDNNNLILKAKDSETGKNFFPLKNPANRFNPKKKLDISKEEPLFIDPSKVDPAEHLSFIGPNITHKTEEGDTTIKALKLDRDDLTEMRRDSYNAIEALKNIYERDKGTPNEIDSKKQFKNVLNEKLNDTAQYTLMFRCNFDIYIRDFGI